MSGVSRTTTETSRDGLHRTSRPCGSDSARDSSTISSGGCAEARLALVLPSCSSLRPGASTLATLIVAIIIAIVGAFLYETLTGASGGGVGKRIAHIRVQSASTQTRPGLRRGFIRALVPAPFAGTPVVGTILVLFDNVPAIWDEEHRAWHDRFAGTIVVAA